MKKLISCALSISMLCSSVAGITAKAEPSDAELFADSVVFKHQNVVGSQTSDALKNDVDEKEITSIPNIIQGMRINQPVFRAYLGSAAANKSYTIKQLLKDGTELKAEEITVTAAGVLEFKHVRNCEAIEFCRPERLSRFLARNLPIQPTLFWQK